MRPALRTISADDLTARVETAAAWIADRWQHTPLVGMILGTGQGHLVEEIRHTVRLDYRDIPYFPHSTAPGHRGLLACGELSGVPCMVMAGRYHLYEGYAPWQITLPVRVMQRLGVETLIVSNAAGGVNPCYRVGDVMAVADHINLTGCDPLLGEKDPAPSVRCPETTGSYDPELLDRALAIARREDFVCHRGIYVALSGPNYETRAEYRMVRRIGGDVVGMSSVPEVIVARRMGLRVLGLSTVTNVCLPDALAATAGEDVAAAASQAEHRMRAIVRGIVSETARCERQSETGRSGMQDGKAPARARRWNAPQQNS